MPTRPLTRHSAAQFELEGVDLSNIITTGERGVDAPPHPSLALLATVKEQVEGAVAAAGDADAAGAGKADAATGGEEAKPDTPEGGASGAAESKSAAVDAETPGVSDRAGLVDALEGLAAACGAKDETVDVKSLLGSNGAVEALFAACEAFLDDEELLRASLRAFRALLPKNAENRRRVPPAAILLSVVAAKRHEAPSPAHGAALALTGSLCVGHEGNKRAVFRNKVVDVVLADLKAYPNDGALVRDALPILRSLCMNDDKTAAMDAKAFDQAREIAKGEALPVLMATSKANPDDDAMSADIMFTLTTLAVNNEVCANIVDIGGLTHVSALMDKHMERAATIRRAVELLKKLAGNDAIKAAICADGADALRLVLSAMNHHPDDARVQEAGAGCVAAVCLRSPDNAATVIRHEGVGCIVRAMRAHPTSAKVQRACCMAIRNMASRDRTLRKNIRDEGVEPLLRAARATHPSIGDHVYAALRDLDLELRGGPVAIAEGSDEDDDADFA